VAEGGCISGFHGLFHLRQFVADVVPIDQIPAGRGYGPLGVAVNGQVQCQQQVRDLQRLGQAGIEASLAGAYCVPGPLPC